MPWSDDQGREVQALRDRVIELEKDKAARDAIAPTQAEDLKAATDGRHKAELVAAEHKREHDLLRQDYDDFRRRVEWWAKLAVTLAAGQLVAGVGAVTVAVILYYLNLKK